MTQTSRNNDVMAEAMNYLGSARLWAAVMTQAHEDAAGVGASVRTAADKDKARLRREAAAAYRAQLHALLWFDSDSDEPGSLRWICGSIPLLSASCERAKARRAYEANKLELPR